MGFDLPGCGYTGILRLCGTDMGNYMGLCRDNVTRVDICMG